MRRLPPEMPLDEVKAVLEAHGWYLARTESSHFFYAKDRDRLSVPRYKGNVKRVYLKQVLDKIEDEAQVPRHSFGGLSRSSEMATLDEILSRNYSFRVDADPDAGGWVIMFPDLPGCITQADTFEEIGEMAQDVFRGWVTASYEAGLPIPYPSQTADGPMPGWDWDAARSRDAGDLAMLTTADMAERLGVSRRRVVALARARGVGSKRGRDVLFSEDDVQRMLPKPVGRPRKPETVST